MRRLHIACLICFVASSIWLRARSSHAQISDPPWAAPPLSEAVVILDPSTQERVALEDFVMALAHADAVLLGEQHTDETTHRFELEVFEQLLKRKQNNVVLALEMFDRDVQPALDRYLAGEIAESEFLAQARPWSNYSEAYRPLVEAAKHAGSRVVASNFPAPIRQKLVMSGADDVSSLTDEEKKLTPQRYLPNSPVYWKRVDNAVRGHVGMEPSESGEQRLYSAQSLWDNAMGEACADALNDNPGHTVLHVNGGFHSANWGGVVHQLRQRTPAAKIVTVAIAPVSNPATQRIIETPSADYLALVEAGATNLNEGKRTVSISKDLSYLLHMPKGASPERPVPLLIWLVDDGLTAEEGMAWCRQRFGESAAIAVLEPPYRELQLDLAVGGRWFWSDTFAEDAGSLVGAGGDVWAYLLRHFPIAKDRVCLAGEGTGATMAAAIALHTDRMSVQAVALAPRQFAKLKDLPLPLPEDFAEGMAPKRTLAVAGPASLSDWWTEELAAYSGVMMPSRFVADEGDALQIEVNRLNLITAALGLEPAAAPSDSSRRTLTIADDSSRARHWGRLQAFWLSNQSGAPVVLVDGAPTSNADLSVSTTILPTAAARPGVLPPCPGPFGGTTVIVLAAETPAEDAEKWIAIETDDPLAKDSRFHRTRVATADGERSLDKVLSKLQSENRRNVLIVPAVFYASATWLQSLKRSARPFEDDMTLQWMPGLGGRRGALGNSPPEP